MKKYLSNELAVNKKNGIATYLGSEAVKQNIINVVGEKRATSFISSVVSAVQTTPALAECTNVSILNAALLGESLDLPPSPQLGLYYLVPFDNTKKVKGENGRDREIKVKEAVFNLGWKGYVQLAIRSGQYKKIIVSEVKEGEITFNPITEEMTIEAIMDMEERNKKETVGYYAKIVLVSGFEKELYWTKGKMKEHAETYSKGYRNDLKKGYKYTFWSKNFDDMAKKTLIRQIISKWGIMSVEMQKAYERDMSVEDANGNPDYIDNKPDEAPKAPEVFKEENVIDVDVIQEAEEVFG